MQLAKVNVPPVWYFVFGAPAKTSLAQQFASEHCLLHLNEKSHSESDFHERVNEGLVIECSAGFFRKLEPIKKQIQVVFVEGDHLSVDEADIKKDYEILGRCVNLKNHQYTHFRKALYPKLVIVFGPCPIQKRFLSLNYFQFSGYVLVQEKISANDILAKLPKQVNYILFEFVPEPSELAVLEEFFNIRIVHLKHQRTELKGHEDFFNLEAKIYPELLKKPYFKTITSDPADFDLIPNIGEALLPQLIYVNGSQKSEKQGAIDYVHSSEGLLLNINQIQEVWKKKQFPPKNEVELIHMLAMIVWRNIDRKQIFFTDYPSKPQDFFILKDKTRSFSLFADCQASEKYQLSQQLTPSIFFLESHIRKPIDPDFPFELQILKHTKYLVISGPPCVGKTSAAKYICSKYGYKHIEYEPYIASVKEKLITPEEGEELPFKKVIGHFTTLIKESGNSPLLIDGLPLDWKDIDNWVKANGPPIVLNLKTEEKELIRRTRKKNEGDLAAEVTEEEGAKAKEAITKNNEWSEQLTARCPSSTVYNIDFTPQLIKGERLLDDVLKPRVFLIQDNPTNLFQNIAVKYNIDFFDVRREPFSQVANAVRKSTSRDIILCNYKQEKDLVSDDFDQIERLIGDIRYLAIFNPESKDINDSEMKLVPPPKEEKPKPAEGEEGEAPPPPEEEGEPKKKALNIYDYKWTEIGNSKNLSQWYFQFKKTIESRESKAESCYKSFSEVLQSLNSNKNLCIYETVSLK